MHTSSNLLILVTLLRGYAFSLYTPTTVSSSSSSSKSSHFRTATVERQTHETETTPPPLPPIVNDEEVKMMHLELIKLKILHKLGLKRPPKGHTRGVKLPETLLSKEIVSNDLFPGDQPEYENTYDDDDEYGKLTKIITFAEKPRQCYRQKPGHCLIHFRLNEKQVSFEDVTSAELWVYKKRDIDDIHNQTFVVKDMKEPHHGFKRHHKEIARKTTQLVRGWIKLDITHAVKRWLKNPLKRHSVMISCLTCSKVKHYRFLNVSGDHKPFLVLNVDTHRSHRTKRTVRTCSDRVRSCCKRHLEVNFTAIGWRFIIRPQVHVINYCSGICNEDADLLRYFNSHVLARMPNPDQYLCCAPKKMGKMSILHYDEQSADIKYEELKNMVVESCDCT